MRLFINFSPRNWLPFKITFEFILQCKGLSIFQMESKFFTAHGIAFLMEKWVPKIKDKLGGTETGIG